MSRNVVGVSFFFSSRRRHTSLTCDWSSDVCSSDLATVVRGGCDGCRPTVATHATVTAATETVIHDSWAAMSATPIRAQRGARPNPDSLRSLRAGAVWTGLPLRERHLLLWLLGAD